MNSKLPKLEKLRVPPEEVLNEFFLNQPAPMRHVLDCMRLLNSIVDVINLSNGYEEVAPQPAPPVVSAQPEKEAPAPPSEEPDAE